MSERREIIMRYEHGRGLVPVNPWEWEALDLYPKDKDLWISIRRRRSIVHNAKYWAWLKEIIDSGVTPYTFVGDLHDAIKVELGLVKRVIRLNGDVVLEPDSTAFHKMGQDEFNVFYTNAERVIAEHFGIG